MYTFYSFYYRECDTKLYVLSHLHVTNMYVVGIYVTYTCGHFVTCAFNYMSAVMFVCVMACVCHVYVMSV